MKYSFVQREHNIYAIDEGGAQYQIDKVLDFNDDNVLCFFVDNGGRLDVVGYYMISSGTIKFVESYTTTLKWINGIGVDNKGDVLYEGEINYRKIEKAHSENNWTLISFRRSNTYRALLIDGNGRCVRVFDNTKGYGWHPKNGIIEFEDTRMQNEKLHYRIDFRQHLIYEFKAFVDVSDSLLWRFRRPPYSYCTIIDEDGLEKKNIAIAPESIGLIKMVSELPLVSIQDAYCSYEQLLVLAKQEGSSDYVYIYCYPDKEHGGYIIKRNIVPGNYKYERIQKTYCKLTLTSPALQFVDPETSTRYLYWYDKMIAQSSEDFHMIAKENSYDEVVSETVHSVSTHKWSVLFCTESKVYNIEGLVVQKFKERGSKCKFKILDTWSDYVAGYYEGTGDYDFFTVEAKMTGNNSADIIIEPAICHIHKITERILISLMHRECSFLNNRGTWGGFDLTQNKFILLPEFKPRRSHVDRDYHERYSTLDDAFEGDAELYSDWLLN